MRLAAIYIKDHFLFENGKPQTINFGGKNIYSFNTLENNEIEITKTENPDFIDGFWGENISLVSAIVGENGAGKTTILEEIMNRSLLFIFEDNRGESFYNDQFEKYENISGAEKSEITKECWRDYISGNQLLKNNDINNEFKFLNNKKLVAEIKNVYDKIKFYDKVEVRIEIDDILKNKDDKTYKENLLEKNNDPNSIYYKLSQIDFNSLNNSTKLLFILLLNLLWRTENLKINLIIDKNNLDNLIKDLITELFLTHPKNRSITQIVISYADVYLQLDKINNEIEINEGNLDFLIKYEKFITDLKVLSHQNFLKNCTFSINPTFELSFGEKQLIRFFSKLYELKDSNTNHNILKILLLDETELGFHPLWKKRYIQGITKVIPVILNNYNVQIIFTTHDPLTLSDIPNSNIVYLKKEGDKTTVLEGKERPQKSFGANIHDLLADSFFIGDGLIGDFAKNKIQEVIDFFKNKKSNVTKENCKKIIEMIDEPMMKNKLLEMYYRKFPKEFSKEFSKELEIKQLKELAKKHKFEIKEI